MSLEMCRLEFIGLKTELHTVIRALRILGCVHIDELSASPEISARPLTLDRETIRLQEELSFLTAHIEGMMEVLEIAEGSVTAVQPNGCLEEARAGIERLRPTIQTLVTRRENLQSEHNSLPRYEATLRKLLPIIPSSAHEPGNTTVGVLVDRVHVGVLEAVGKEILDISAGRAEVVASDVDSFTRAMLIVFPREFTDKVESLLGREDVSRLRLPAELGEGPPDVILATLRRRMSLIPEEIKAIDQQLSGLAAQWGDRLVAWRYALREELDTNSVLSLFGETDMTFVLVGWVPVRDLARVKGRLEREFHETVLVRHLPLTRELRKQAPVILQNPTPARPFESLVNLLALPKYGRIDPTRLMALFLPIFFGMILGDIGYGALLLGLSLLFQKKFKTGVVRDILTVLAFGSAWSIVFGLLFGEAFGTLGELFGLHALWFDRASSDHVFGLLTMTVAVGAIHITLGLVLGIWEAYKDHSRSHLLERGGMLIGLMALFMITAVLAEFLPDSFMTPAIGGLVLGVVLLGASLGWLGILMGPIEFIGLIGNVLSYLRIAAIGLASVYLAKAANDIAGIAGNIILGVIVAVLIHALNLVLGAFSPTIHSLRLHYVEFFRKFYEGGGRPYRPYRSQPAFGRGNEADSPL